jgi:hypothetical protein
MPATVDHLGFVRPSLLAMSKRKIPHASVERMVIHLDARECVRRRTVRRGEAVLGEPEPPAAQPMPAAITVCMFDCPSHDVAGFVLRAGVMGLEVNDRSCVIDALYRFTPIVLAILVTVVHQPQRAIGHFDFCSVPIGDLGQ